MRCAKCGVDMVQVASRTVACPECGTRHVTLGPDATAAARGWMAVHPFKDIPNAEDAPLFTTSDRRRIDAVLAWSRRHPGKPVPQALLDDARMKEDEVTETMLGLFVESGLLRKSPGVAWAFLRTGLFTGEEVFDNLLLDRRFEYRAALEEWAAMPPALQEEVLRGLEAKFGGATDSPRKAPKKAAKASKAPAKKAARKRLKKRPK